MAVKVLRASIQGDPDELKKVSTGGRHNTWLRADRKQRFCKEMVVWKHLSCPYLLKFNGVFYHNGMPAVVTPWMSNGCIIEYLEKHTDANPLRLVGWSIPPGLGTSSLRTLMLHSY